MDNKYTVENVKEVLEENLGLTWTDKLIYNPLTKYYHTAVQADLVPDKQIYVHMIDNKKTTYLGIMKFNEEEFTIRVNGMKVDASEHWKELLDNEINTTQTK